MGALTENRKRLGQSLTPFSPLDLPPSKKPRSSSPPPPPPPSALDRTTSEDNASLPPLTPLRRIIHGPQRIIKAFGLGSSPSSAARVSGSGRLGGAAMGGVLSGFFRARETALGSLWCWRNREDVAAEVNSGSDGLEVYKKLVKDAVVVTKPLPQQPVAPVVCDLTELTQEDEEETPMRKRTVVTRRLYDARTSVVDQLAEDVEVVRRGPVYKELQEESNRRDERLSHLDFQVPDYSELFAPLTSKEEEVISCAMQPNSRYSKPSMEFPVYRRRVLLMHENSGIEITGEIMQCLKPHAWLNDEIFVPIHKEVHWCLAIINVKEKKLQYLDSLGGKDTHVLGVLARYFVDEVKEKSERVIDMASWEIEFVDGLPQQENGFDCGMFMIKYADFYSRGLPLAFGQKQETHINPVGGGTQTSGEEEEEEEEMAHSRRKYKKSRAKVRVALPKKKPNVFKPAFSLPPQLSSSSSEWDDKASILKNYRSFGVVSNPNLLGVRARSTPLVLQSSSLQLPRDADDLLHDEDPGSDLESDDLKTALGKRRRDGKQAALLMLTAMQRLHVGKLVEKYGDDYQAMFMDTKLNRMQHSAGTLKKLCERYQLPNSCRKVFIVK
ncbi:Ubiquitin-like-specific protease ESD4 [Acorus calamus]|uniref:Nucleolar protein 16 n=1 Tax=Acorus calamus TaxID=4465 RepID=A0AAV9EQ10_ACOCL|nr:Ubiquitin-like-specific protease ESD4 [Acorus calamus]